MKAPDIIFNEVTRLGSDIGRHAASEALGTLTRIIATLPTDAHRAVALGVATAIIRAKIDGIINMGDSPADKILQTTHQCIYEKHVEAQAGLLEAIRTGGAEAGLAYAKAHGLKIPPELEG